MTGHLIELTLMFFNHACANVEYCRSVSLASASVNSILIPVIDIL